jgi:hypothetical protein
VAVTAAVTFNTFLGERKDLELPPEPRVGEFKGAGAVLNARKLFAFGTYWQEAGARYVFVEPEKVREFKPVDLDVPTVGIPKIVMPLPDPGPLLRFSDRFVRLDGSSGRKPPAPEPEPVDDGAEKKDGGGE